MRNVVFGALLLIVAGLSAPARAQEPGAAEGVIRSQIDAFLADDFARAFTYASPMIQNMFRTPDNFGMMVRQGYPMVWRPAELRFGAREERGGRVYQEVMITDQGGRLHVPQYEMLPGGESWEINGVRFLEAPQVGA